MIKLNLNQFYNEGVLNLSAFTDALTEAQAGDTEGALTYLGGFLDHYKAASSDTVVERIGKDLLAEVFIVTPTSSIDWPTGNVESVLHGEGYMVVFQFKPVTQESAAMPPDILRINLTALFVDDLVGPQTMLESILEKAQKDGRWAVSVETMQQTRDALFLNIDLFREIVMRYDDAVLDIFVPDGDRVASWTTHSQKASFEQQRADDNIIRPRFSHDVPENLRRPQFRFQQYVRPNFNEQQYNPHPQDRWPGLTNEGIIELLNCYSLTQIKDFPPGIPTTQLPQGLDLLHLIQLRLGADRMHRGMPNMFGGMPNMFPGGVFQANMFNDARFNKPQGVFDAAREAMRGAYRPTGSAGQPGGCEVKFVPRLKLHFVPAEADSLIDLMNNIRRSVIKQIGLTMATTDRDVFVETLIEQIHVVLMRNPFPDGVVQNKDQQITLETGYPVQLTRGLMVDYRFTNWILYPRTDANKDGAITGPLDWLRWGGSMMDDYDIGRPMHSTTLPFTVTDSFSFVLNMSLSITMERFEAGLYAMSGLPKPQLDDHVRKVTKALQGRARDLALLLAVETGKEVRLHYTVGRIETLAEGLQKMLWSDYSGWCVHSDLVHSEQYDMKVPAFIVTGSGMYNGHVL
jgi:hypothetical protein